MANFNNAWLTQWFAAMSDNHAEFHLSETNEQHHSNKSGSINYDGGVHNGNNHLGAVQGGQNNGSGSFAVTNHGDSVAVSNGNANKISNNGNNSDGDDMTDDSDSEDNDPENDEENQGENARTEAVGNNEDIDDLDINMDMNGDESAPRASGVNANKNEEKEEKYSSNSDGQNNHGQDSNYYGGKNEVVSGQVKQKNESNADLNCGNNGNYDGLLRLSDDEFNKFLEENPNLFNSMTCGPNVSSKHSVKDLLILDIQQPEASCGENETMFKVNVIYCDGKEEIRFVNTSGLTELHNAKCGK